MDGPRDHHTKQSKLEKNTTYMWNLKYNTHEHIYETERDSQTQRTHRPVADKGEKEGGGRTGSLGSANAN